MSFVIVMGPGRSGTSAVARVLHESGFSMGEAFAPGNEHNATGYYEERAVVDVNERIMAACGMQDMASWPSRARVLEAAAAYRDEQRALVAGATARGWKDPRFCVTLEAWLPLFASPPRVVLCLRSAEAFVHSAIAVFGLQSTRETMLAYWEEHMRRALDVVRDYGLEATSVVYDDLLRRPAETVRALSEFVGHPLDASYVEPGLRHHDLRVPAHHLALWDEARALAYRALAHP